MQEHRVHLLGSFSSDLNCERVSSCSDGVGRPIIATSGTRLAISLEVTIDITIKQLSKARFNKKERLGKAIYGENLSVVLFLFRYNGQATIKSDSELGQWVINELINVKIWLFKKHSNRSFSISITNTNKNISYFSGCNFRFLKERCR